MEKDYNEVLELDGNNIVNPERGEEASIDSREPEPRDIEVFNGGASVLVVGFMREVIQYDMDGPGEVLTLEHKRSFDASYEFDTDLISVQWGEGGRYLRLEDETGRVNYYEAEVNYKIDFLSLVEDATELRTLFHNAESEVGGFTTGRCCSVGYGSEQDTEHQHYGAAVMYVTIDDDGTMWAGNGEYSTRINLCPFCGQKAPKQLSEDFS